MIKYPNLDLLRYKKYQSLCDSWELENFGYWGNAPLWATKALDNLGRMQEKYGYSRIIQGKLEVPSRWEGVSLASPEHGYNKWVGLNFSNFLSNRPEKGHKGWDNRYLNLIPSVDIT